MALDRRIVELYDEYTHKPLDRRVFFNRLMVLAGSATAAEAALAVLEPNYAQAQQIAPGSPCGTCRIVAPPCRAGASDTMPSSARSSAESRALQLHSARNARPRWASTNSNRLAQAGAVSSGRPSGTTISRIRCSPPRPALRAAAQARNNRTISPCANLSRPDAMLFTHLLSCE